MRPVNLIPPEERRGAARPAAHRPARLHRCSARSSLVLAGVTALVLTGNQISERKDEVGAARSAKTPQPTAEADSASPPTPSSRHLQRTAGGDGRQPRRQPLRLGAGDARTLADPAARRLADRPRRVGLVRKPAATAAAAPAATCAARSPARRWKSAAAPTGQEAVAGFVTALKDIDGVTRVGVESSELSDQEEGAGSSGGSANPVGRLERLPDPQVHRQVQDRRRLRRGAGADRAAEAKPKRPPTATETAADHVRAKRSEGSEGG